MSRYEVAVGSTQIYTMRELNQRTAEVMREINESGRPAAITRRGRFIALVTPLTTSNVEAAALEAVLRATENITQLTGETTTSGAATLEDAAEDLGVAWRPHD